MAEQIKSIEEWFAVEEEYVNQKQRIAELEQDKEDADLLLGNSWQQVVDIAKGEQGVETALRIQCTGLAGDVAELNDRIAKLEAERDRLRAVVEKLPKYADTGEPITDMGWFIGRIGDGTYEIIEKYLTVAKAGHPLYSTFDAAREAAEQAATHPDKEQNR